MFGNQIRKNVRPQDRNRVPDRQTFPLNKGAAISITTMNGKINVEAWDQPQAEVRIIKRGKSGADFQGATVDIKNDKNNLTLDASQSRNAQISFEIQLPRDLGAVKFTSTNGAINVSDIAGNIIIEATNGEINSTMFPASSALQLSTAQIKADLNGAAKIAL